MWRNRSPTDQATSKATTQHLIKEYVLTGSGRSYGSIWASTLLEEKLRYRARRRDVAAALRTLDPEGTAARTPGLRRARIKNYITDGPNQLWCLDGHDKISQYYIQIYAAVDAYSRKVLWIYCGTANRAKYSILYQYLQTVRLLGRCPRYIRTDKGSETGAVAAAQFRLFIEHAFKEPGWSDAEYEALSLSDCYVYGPSTANVRIESLWSLLRRQTTGKWIRLFTFMRKCDLYREEQHADLIAFLFVFMPLIRGGACRFHARP